MRLVTEAEAAELVSMTEAIEAVRGAFVALADGRAELFPVASGPGTDPSTRMSAKSGRIDGVALGVKVGTYWPPNAATGRPTHGSTVLLLDDATGEPVAAIGATHLTSLRTAAADAVAADALARPDARTLTLVGTGHQAFHDAVAVAAVRPLDRVLVAGRDAGRAAALATRLEEAGLPARPAPTLADAVAEADIVSTVTAARAALVRSEWVAPGTHISAMGADSPGKQELDVELAGRSRCVTDVVAQAVTIGELQHAVAAGAVTPDDIATIGDVLTGRATGRLDDQAVTVFDSSGTALQDLAVADLAWRRWAQDHA